jgi:tryptophan-rich hypothetical protein
MPVNSKKLQGSKWTATTPHNREKHFLVVQVEHDAEDPQKVLRVTLEAVLSRRHFTLPWRELGDTSLWQAGWL